MWGPEDRVLISDFSEIDAVAASPWLVFAATPHGLLVYDRTARGFKPPVTSLDGYPGGRVRRAIADPSGNAVWLDLGGGLGGGSLELASAQHGHGSVFADDDHCGPRIVVAASTGGRVALAAATGDVGYRIRRRHEAHTEPLEGPTG